MAGIQVELWPREEGGEQEEHITVQEKGPVENGRLGSLPAEDITDFIASPGNPSAYAGFVRGIFKESPGLSPDDKIWNLLAYLEDETDFYSAPASTRYHGAEPCGLIRHSLMVLANGIKLAPLMLGAETDRYYLTVSCLFHDLCKVNMYEPKTRNVKNEKTGEWEKEPFYAVRQDYISFGHGIESLLRLSRFISLSDPWRHAVRWHMGAYDLSPLDKMAMDKALTTYREVLFLQTADMLAGVVDAV
ncbi:MAG: HD domain-containing protein [Treponema sp.]|jgi:hypothetical protein|nr:HD domain-containing protein [Treponema sp.]